MTCPASRIAFFPQVNDDGQFQFSGQVKLLTENALLVVVRSGIPVVVQADLADGNHFGILG